MDLVTSFWLLLLASNVYVWGIRPSQDYALVPDSSGMGVLASPNFPFTHCWGNYSYTLFAGKPHNVCFKFYRFRLASRYDYLTVRTGSKNHIFIDQGLNDNAHSEMKSVWQEPLCFPVDEYFKLRIDLSMSNMRNVEDNDEPFGFYATYMVGVFGLIPEITAPASCEYYTQYRCFGQINQCVQKKDVCGPTALCPGRTDLTFAHARCLFEDEEKEWDFEQAGRSLGMLYYYADSHGWIYNTTTNHEYPIMITLDHTNITPKSALGGYLRVDPGTDEATLHIDAPSSLQNKHRCFQFWYFMRGPEVGYLMLTAQFRYNTKQSIVWSRKGGLDNDWFQGQVEFLDNSDVQRVSFLAAQDSRSKENIIALDDISWSEGACPVGDDVSTTFGDWSGEKWRAIMDYPGSISYRLGTIVHCGKALTTRAPTSYYYLWFQSPVVSKLNAKMCFSFWYNTDNYLKDFSIRIIGLSTEITHATGIFRTSGNYYRRYRTELPEQSEPFKVEVNITAPQTKKDSYRYTVSDPVIIDHPCSSLETCVRYEYECADKRCVPSGLFCDGKPDCDDGSDEWYSSGCKQYVQRKLQIALPIVAAVLVVCLIGMCVCLWKKNKCCRSKTTYVVDTPPSYNEVVAEDLRLHSLSYYSLLSDQGLPSSPDVAASFADAPPSYHEAIGGCYSSQDYLCHGGRNPATESLCHI